MGKGRRKRKVPPTENFPKQIKKNTHHKLDCKGEIDLRLRVCYSRQVKSRLEITSHLNCSSIEKQRIARLSKGLPEKTPRFLIILKVPYNKWGPPTGKGPGKGNNSRMDSSRGCKKASWHLFGKRSSCNKLGGWYRLH